MRAPVERTLFRPVGGGGGGGSSSPWGRESRERYREIRSPAHEWPPSSGRNETVWRDSYLFPPEVDWNIFYRRLAPFPSPPLGPTSTPFSGASSWRSLREVRRRANRKRKLGGFFMGKMVANFALSFYHQAGGRDGKKQRGKYIAVAA